MASLFLGCNTISALGGRIQPFRWACKLQASRPRLPSVLPPSPQAPWLASSANVCAISHILLPRRLTGRALQPATCHTRLFCQRHPFHDTKDPVLFFKQGEYPDLCLQPRLVHCRYDAIDFELGVYKLLAVVDCVHKLRYARSMCKVVHLNAQRDLVRAGQGVYRQY